MALNTNGGIPLEWLCCPSSHEPLRRADAELIARLESARKAGTLQFRRPPAVCQIDLEEPITDGLRTAADFYLVSRGLPVLLPDHALVIPA